VHRTSVGSLSGRDSGIVLLGLAAVAGLGWAYLFQLSQAGGMGMETAGPQLQDWRVFDLTATLAMWITMMVAMMLPSAAPAILLFTAINRNAERPLPFAAPIFTSGYLAGWVGFGALATLAQWGLHSAGLLLPNISLANPIGGGLILIAAGLFQWTLLKYACLAHCRSPQGFFITEWRSGAGGAFRMGLKHSGYCLGCCWLLMTLLFAAGVMNLLWVAAIAAFILLEKLIPSGQWVIRIAGLLLLILVLQREFILLRDFKAKLVRLRDEPFQQEIHHEQISVYPVFQTTTR